jgi:hypothetical protein
LRGEQPIVGAVFTHWFEVARKSGGRGTSRQELLQEVIPFLISADWVIGEARDQRVVVTNAAVRTRFDRIRREQFPHPGDLQRFLRASGQTVSDLLLRVRLDMLSTGLRRKVLRHGGQRALNRFVGHLRAKWTAMTCCEAAHTVADCGHPLPSA